MPTDDRIYYDRKTHLFWIPTPKEGYTEVSRESLKVKLAILGKSSDKGQSIASPADMFINDIINNNQVHIACNVAGWPMGVHLMYGKQVLVMQEPPLLKPAQGDWSFYDKVFRAVSRLHPIQYDVLLSWLKLGMEKIYGHEFRYSQILAMLGDSQSGKSLVHLMITVMLGESVVDPTHSLAGDTHFNKDGAEAMHLSMEEPSLSTFKDRQTFANNVKKQLVTEARRYRGLYSEAVQFCPLQVVSMSTNKEFDNLSIYPSIEAGFEDKIHLLNFPDNSMPLPGYEHLKQKQVRQLVSDQAPAFLWHLFHEYQIPATLLTRVNGPKHDCHRFGMDAYHNPEIMELLEEKSSELKLFACLRRIAKLNGSLIRGTATKLCDWMRTTSSDPEALRLSKNSDRVGSLLRNLHKKFPHLVQKDGKEHNAVIWLILAESNDGN